MKVERGWWRTFLAVGEIGSWNCVLWTLKRFTGSAWMMMETINGFPRLIALLFNFSISIFQFGIDFSFFFIFYLNFFFS